MSDTEVSVQLPDRQYSIHIGRALISQAALYPPNVREGRLIVVSNVTVAPLYLARLRQALNRDPLVHLLPDGEEHKSLAELERLLDVMLEQRLGRDSTVVALGGGVVGDLAGFAAAIYQRGIELVQIPTTLLSQVDSSVGGKTAVNHPRGKNMIGAFHQPSVVITDLDTLDSLPEREFLAGVAEIIKYDLLGDAEFFAWLEDNMGALLSREDAALRHAIAQSCRHKAAIVAADETEKGQRALLNLGHTFGHAIEAFQQYRGWLHGEAVAVGMCMAADLSARHGWINRAASERVCALIAAAGLPTTPPAGLSPTTMLDLMQGDKKAARGRVRLVLLQALGQAVLSSDYDDALLEQTLDACCQS